MKKIKKTVKKAAAKKAPAKKTAVKKAPARKIARTIKAPVMKAPKAAPVKKIPAAEPLTKAELAEIAASLSEMKTDIAKNVEDKKNLDLLEPEPEFIAVLASTA